MPRVFGGRGRPDSAASAARKREFLRLLAAGLSPHEAAKGAGVKPERALKLLADRPFRQAFCALLDQAEEAA